jgi:hypothetical protein
VIGQILRRMKDLPLRVVGDADPPGVTTITGGTLALTGTGSIATSTPSNRPEAIRHERPTSLQTPGCHHDIRGASSATCTNKTIPGRSLPVDKTGSAEI